MIASRHRTAAAALAGIALAAGLGGCASIKDHKGYVVDSTLIDSVQPGLDNRDSVVKTLGRPSFVAQFDENTWYYISRNTKQLAFQKPKPTDQVLLAVKFDGAGNVASVSKGGLEKAVKINPIGDKTPTLGRERGFFSELFGNIGRVGAVSQGGTTADNPN